MKVIVTGATGMVGEGVLLECLANPAVERVLSVSRKPCGHAHPKLEECLIADFREPGAAEAKLAGHDACFYCAGVSSVGMTEADYTRVTYDTALTFARTLATLNPGMVMNHVSGASTDGTGQGRVMWARVKGRTENALAQLPFKAVFNYRPGLMLPMPGQKNLKRGYRVMLAFAPLLKRIFPSLTLKQVARAMVNATRGRGAPKPVLEVADIAALAAAT